MRRIDALRVLEEVAAEQAGLITSAQATARGVDRVTQRRLVDAALLENVGRGVYRVVGAPPPPQLETRVAWLRLDPATPAWQRDGLGPDDGVVSHRSAAILHELGDIPAPQIELTVPRRRTTREPGVRLHTGKLAAPDITFVEGLPVTTVEKTIVDLLESHADGAHVGRIIADTDRRALVDMSSLNRKVAVYGKRYGLPHNDGAGLLSNLAEQAGERLSTMGIQHATPDHSGTSEAVHRTVAPHTDLAQAPRDERLLAAVAKAVGPNSEKLLAAFTQSLIANDERLSASLAQAAGSMNEELSAAITNALTANIQAISAQAVAAILSSWTAAQQRITAAKIEPDSPPRKTAAGRSHASEDEE